MNTTIITNSSFGSVAFLEQQLRQYKLNPDFFCDLVSLGDFQKHIANADFCILMEDSKKDIVLYLTELAQENPHCVFIYYWDSEERQHQLLKHVVQRKRGSYLVLAQKIVDSMNLKSRT